ncbi:MAG: ribokinase [Balneola sp.]|nr:MAG: ribokinase [Balneola sp.]
MSPNKIVVVGSSNTDMVIYSDRIPRPGETILGGTFKMNPGGKGANQAVAAARLGGNVSFVSSIGSDIFGKESLSNFNEAGIDSQYVSIQAGTPSGVALILVDAQGENSIAVASGANSSITTADIDKATPAIQAAQFMLIQLEIPLPIVSYCLEIAEQENCKVILNPAPAQALDDKDLQRISIITPNETEAEILTGITVTDLESARKAATALRDKGIEYVIITLGSQGAYVLTSTMDQIIPTQKVTAVDTTAAGDTFNGALAVALSENMELKEAVAFANRAAAISVTRKGAQASVPFRKELTDLLTTK